MDAGLDQAPVLQNDRLVGYATTIDLKRVGRGRVARATRPLAGDLVIGESAPVGKLLSVLAAHEFAFIAAANGISAFVTPSDLNKHASRTHFYLQVARLEIAMSEFLKMRFPRPVEQAQLLDNFDSEARSAIECRFLQDQKSGVEIDYLTYFEFRQLLKAIGRVSTVRRRLGLGSQKKWNARTESLCDLRNAVMHPTRELLSPIRSVADLIDAERLMNEILGQLTAEALTAAPMNSESDRFQSRRSTPSSRDAGHD